MINEDFLALVPGAIGQVTYRKKVTHEIPKKAKDDFIDRFVNSKMNAMMIKVRHNPGEDPADPMAEFMKAREIARAELEEGRVGTRTEAVNLQIGQAESYQLVAQIESDPDFVDWNFPELIKMFKETDKDQKPFGVSMIKE